VILTKVDSLTEDPESELDAALETGSWYLQHVWNFNILQLNFNFRQKAGTFDVVTSFGAGAAVVVEGEEDSDDDDGVVTFNSEVGFS